MTISVKKFIALVSAFAVLTIVYLVSPDKPNEVFWAIYSFAIKDILIISLSLLFVGRHKISDLFAIGLSCYLIVPTILRLSCAFKARFNYAEYRELLLNSEYSYFLLLVLLFISILIYHGWRDERKI